MLNKRFIEHLCAHISREPDIKGWFHERNTGVSGLRYRQLEHVWYPHPWSMVDKDEWIHWLPRQETSPVDSLKQGVFAWAYG